MQKSIKPNGIIRFPRFGIRVLETWDLQMIMAWDVRKMPGIRFVSIGKTSVSGVWISQFRKVQKPNGIKRFLRIENRVLDHYPSTC